MNVFSNAPLWIFAISFFGAILTWPAAARFRGQILADSHKLVRASALRYLQITVGMLAVFVLGMVLSVGCFATRSIQASSVGPVPTAMETPSVTATPDLALLPLTPAAPPISTDVPLLPTAPVALPQTGPTLAATNTAVVVNTDGLGVNARSVPGLGGAVISLVPEGARLTVLDETRQADNFTWHLVNLPDGQQGWIASRFLVFEGQ